VGYAIFQTKLHFYLISILVSNSLNVSNITSAHKVLVQFHILFSHYSHRLAGNNILMFFGKPEKYFWPTLFFSRLRQDYMRLKKDPVPYIVAEPLPSNMLEWHYCVSGPEQSPYHGGLYHGKLVFPAEFPFKPPSIYMITPNGRFKCNTRLCLSM